MPAKEISFVWKLDLPCDMCALVTDVLLITGAEKREIKLCGSCMRTLRRIINKYDTKN